MLNIGCHLSVTKGYLHMGEEALSIDANTFQFFSRNPRGSKTKAMDLKDVAALMDLLKKHRFAPILAHAPYTLNPAAADERIRDFAGLVFREDLANLEYLPGTLYNFHPGSHVGQGVENGIQLIIGQLNAALKPGQATTVLLETMSGKGSEIGVTFAELRTIIDGVELNDHLGVCLDTCHVFAAGYDIVNDLDGVLDEFDKTIGLSRLLAIHLNDSMMPFNSKKDRHAKIGEGTIGLEAMTRIINHPLLHHLPFYLETPNEVDGYAREIKILRAAYKDL